MITGGVMGLRIRRSINMGGGFRINLSKSGISYSWAYQVTASLKLHKELYEELLYTRNWNIFCRRIK